MSVSKRMAKMSSPLMNYLIAPATMVASGTAAYLNPYRTGQQKDPSVGSTALAYGVPLGATAGAVAGYKMNKLVNNVLDKGTATVFGTPVQKLAPYSKAIAALAAGSTGAAVFGTALGAAAKGARLRREDEWASLSRDKDRVQGTIDAGSPDGRVV